MSFRDCIQKKIESKLLTPKQVESLLKEYDSLVKRYSQTMSNEVAANNAAAKIVAVKGEILKRKKQNMINGALAQERIVSDINSRINQNKTKLFTEIGNLYERAHIRGRAVFRQSVMNVGEFIEKHRPKWAGITQDHEGMPDVVRSMLGEKTNNADANMFGQQLRKAFDLLHKRYENAGGIMGKIDNYFPQVHQKELVKKLTDEQWIQELLPKLDRERMVDIETGLPFSDEDLIKIMKKDYKDIISNGKYSLKKRADEGMQTSGYGKGLEERRSSSRFYHFKDADSFLEYNNKFGNGTVGLFDTILNHMQSLSNDIGVLETLGPKPNSIARHLDLQMEASGTGKVKQKWTNGMYDVLAGRTMGDGDDPKWYRWLGNTQDLMRSAYLGSAPVSALSDSTFAVLGAKANGLSGVRALKRYIGQLNPSNYADRRSLARAGYVAEIASHSAYSAARFSDELTGRGSFRWLATFTNKASGLEAMTVALKNAVTLELQGSIAEFKMSKTSWGNLPKEFRDAAMAHGFDEQKWELVLKTNVFKNPDNQATFIRPEEILQTKGDSKLVLDTANALEDWTQSIRHTAANEPTLRTRSIQTGAILGDARPGTLNRAMMSSFMMFKGFPITVIFNHTIGAIKDASRGRLSNLAILGIGTTIMGAVATQVGDIIKGKDPRDMDDHRFWMASALRGGGLGLFGDFMFAEYSRFGRDPVHEFFGPVVGLGSDVLRVGVGNYQRALEDENYKTTERYLRDVFNLAKRHIPAGNLWYGRLVMERALLDEIEQMVDPNYSRNKRKLENRMAKDYGQRYWWRPGESEASRLPQF